MNVALITIGNELLYGFTVNTNAAWIGKELTKIGAHITIQVAIKDNIHDIIDMLEYLSNTDVEAIITTGGLGPTPDDITPTAYYQYFGANQEFDEKYWHDLEKRFKKRGIKIAAINRNQAIKPSNGDMIINPVGSARGLHFKKDNKQYFALPGVPVEMKAMMTDSVIGSLKEEIKGDLFIRTLRTTGIPESTLAEQISDITTREVEVAFLPQVIGVDLRLISRNKSAIIQQESKLKNALGNAIFGKDKDKIEQKVGELLSEKKYTLSLAESCTGGLICSRLTDVPGSSDYLLGGVVSYSNAAKINLIGVDNSTLDKYGAVSPETATEMVLGVCDLFKTDVGISVTGVAGPGGGSDEKPVGLVYVGVCIKDNLTIKEFQFGLNRRGNKLLSSQAALNLLRMELLNE